MAEHSTDDVQLITDVLLDHYRHCPVEHADEGVFERCAALAVLSVLFDHGRLRQPGEREAFERQVDIAYRALDAVQRNLARALRVDECATPALVAMVAAQTDEVERLRAKLTAALPPRDEETPA